MSVDRTREFLALVDAAAAAMGAQRPGGGSGGAQALSARPHHPSAATRPLVPPASSSQQPGAQPQQYESRSAFLAAVREVSSDLNRTSLKLSALTKLVKKRGMFDESGAEVERLTLSIKADMEAQSGRLDGLQDYIARKRSEAVAGGAKPGRPLPNAEDAANNAAGGGKPAPGGRVVGAGQPHPPDLLSSVQGISHGDVIVGQLKGQLLGFTRSLKGILQERSEAMKAQADRRQQFGAVRDLGRPLSLAPVSVGSGGGGGLPPIGGAALAAATAPGGGWRGSGGGGGTTPQPQPSWQQQHALPQAGGGAAAQRQQPAADHAVVSFGGGGGASPSTPSAADAFQQMSQAQLVPEAAFLNARAQDVQQIERHIHDLSSLFSRLAHVVAEQGALVERIEDETETALQNMEAGQAQLGRYWERVSSNRGLALRVASMLVGAAILFSVFGV